MTTLLEYSLSVWLNNIEIDLIDKLHNFERGICFPNNGCHGKRKKEKHHFALIIARFAMSKKCFFKNLNLIDLDYH